MRGCHSGAAQKRVINISNSGGPIRFSSSIGLQRRDTKLFVDVDAVESAAAYTPTPSPVPPDVTSLAAGWRPSPLRRALPGGGVARHGSDAPDLSA